MKHLEKIIFLVCLLVAGGAAAWVFLMQPEEEVEAEIPTLADGFELGSYRGLEVIEEASWPPPAAQDSEGKWLFSVFTPPIIYLVDGVLTVERPEKPDDDDDPVEPLIPPFGVRFVEIQQDRYRLQLAAVYETTLDEVDSVILSFENVYAGLTDRPTITLKKGETSEEYEFRVEDVEKEERRDEGGGLETVYIVTITDLRTGEEVVLTDNTTLLEDEIRFLLESTINPGETAVVENIGDTFRMNDGASYTLVTISLDDETVEVLKEAEYLDVPEQKTLSLVDESGPREADSAGESEPTSEPDPTSEPEGSFETNGFDAIFN